MHDAQVAVKIANFFKMQRWRAAIALTRAMLAYEKGRYQAALSHWSRLVQFDSMRTSEYMAFYAVLMALSKRPAKEALAIFSRVAAGEFHRDHKHARYAEALAHYWIAFLTNRSDVMERWLDAYRLKPGQGWVAQRLTLPDNPIDPARPSSSPTGD